MLDQLDATNGDLLLINIVSTCFWHFYAHRQEKSPFVASSWYNTYLLIKDARSLEHKDNTKLGIKLVLTTEILLRFCSLRQVPQLL